MGVPQIIQVRPFSHWNPWWLGDPPFLQKPSLKLTSYTGTLENIYTNPMRCDKRYKASLKDPKLRMNMSTTLSVANETHIHTIYQPVPVPNYVFNKHWFRNRIIHILWSDSMCRVNLESMAITDLKVWPFGIVTSIPSFHWRRSELIVNATRWIHTDHYEVTKLLTTLTSNHVLHFITCLNHWFAIHLPSI